MNEKVNKMNENDIGKVVMNLSHYNTLFYEKETYERKYEELHCSLNRRQDIVDFLLREYVRNEGYIYAINKDNIEQAYDLEGCDCVLSRDKIIHLLRLGITEYEIQCAIREVVLEKMNKETDNG